MRRKQRLCGESAFLLRIRLKDAQEYRPLVAEDGIEARSSNAHPGDKIVNRHSVVAFRPEHLGRLFQRPRLVEAARSTHWPSGILNHRVQNSLTISLTNI